MASDVPSRRHRWVRLRVHVYICERCGCGRENVPTRDGWRQTYHTPDGQSSERKRVPLCESGARTGDYLRKHESAIAVGGLRKERGQTNEGANAAG